MAISNNTVLEVRTTGSDTNGGGFVTGASGTDFSQQASANSGGNNGSTTDAVAAGTTTLTSATGSFTSAIVGNIIYLQGGSGSLTAVWKQVTAFTNSTTITLDSTVATGTGITMNIGGALASPGQAAAIAIGTNKIWVQTGTYAISSASTNVSGGCVSLTLGGTHMQGYGVTRGDLGTPPLLQAGSISTFTIIATSAASNLVMNFIVDGQSKTSSRGVSGAAGSRYYLVTAKNCTNNGLQSATNACFFIACAATGCSTASAISAFTCYLCEAYSNTFTGFTGGVGALAYCLSYSNSGASSDGFDMGANGVCYNCAAYGNGRDGFRTTAPPSTQYTNCIAEGNAAYGFNDPSVYHTILLNCAGYNNATANTNLNTSAYDLNLGFITGTAEFFVAAASGNFALNSIAGGGALLRAAGLAGAFPDGTTTGYIDVGPVQHQTAATISVECHNVVIRESTGVIGY